MSRIAVTLNTIRRFFISHEPGARAIGLVVDDIEGVFLEHRHRGSGCFHEEVVFAGRKPEESESFLKLCVIQESLVLFLSWACSRLVFMFMA